MYAPKITRDKKSKKEENEAVINEKKRVKNGYDSLGGEGYNQRYREEQDVKYDIIFSILKVTFDELILDNGCGTGMLLERLYTPSVGFDLTSGLLNSAKINLKNFQFLVNGDAEFLPFRNKIFYSTISVTLIQNTPYPENVLNEIKRVTKKGNMSAVTALKKAFSLEQFKELLKNASFSSYNIIEDISSYDWFAIIEI
ncbi:methyltransferase domain-containing protein [Candidatus Bathyarchaeota archaeon]|nr:methyltransferase domain-containing protein [Candidatus Bathyarchaeota archaeon]